MKLRTIVLALTAGIVPACGSSDGAAAPSGSLEWVLEAVGADVHVRFLALDDTHVYLAGGGGPHPWRIEKRRKSDGQLEPGFGAAGILSQDPTADNDMLEDVLLHDGALYLLGYNDDPRLEKRSAIDGALDPNFGTGGVLTTELADGQGRLSHDATHLYIANGRVEKLSLASGDHDPAFGTNGVSDIAFAGNVSPQVIAHDGGALFVAGPDGSGTNGWVLERRSAADGDLDGAFGVGGVVRSASSIGFPRITDVATVGDGVLMCGFESPTAAGSVWRTEKRAKTDGAPIAAFGPGGVLSYDSPTSTGERIEAMDASGDDLYLFGVEFVGAEPQWRVEKRALSDGALRNGFGSGGALLSAFSGPGTFAYAVKADATHIYLLGRADGPAAVARWRLEKRLR